jgi:hypothetical protein
MRPLQFASGTVQMMIRIPREQRDSLREITTRDGIPMAEQVRRAMAMWIESRSVDKKRK